MIPTKTYPLSAIMGKEIEEEYERGYAQGCEEGKERIAELEAQLADANEMLEKCNSKFIVALEAEVKTLREALIDMRSGWKYIRETHGDLYGVGWDRAQNKADAALAAREGK